MAIFILVASWMLAGVSFVLARYVCLDNSSCHTPSYPTPQSCSFTLKRECNNLSDIMLTALLLYEWNSAENLHILEESKPAVQSADYNLCNVYNIKFLTVHAVWLLIAAKLCKRTIAIHITRVLHSSCPA